LPAGDVDYDAGEALGYSARRRADPRIAARVHAALGDARTVLNVGAGAGSYEPQDRYVIAVEPSAAMRAQRTLPAVDATAEALPFDDDAFDAAMATLTIHQWRDADAGLRELRRVARGPVAILTFDGDALPDFWLGDYVPGVLAGDAARFPELDRVAAILGGARVTVVPVALDCQDGFLDPAVRRSQSCWGFGDAGDGIERLRDDLASGAWDARHGHLRTQPEYSGALRLVVAV
jgi:hypothetical protein